MSQTIVGVLGDDLAIRVPIEIASAAGIVAVEYVEIETRDRDIVIRRSVEPARADALAAVEVIIAESEGYSLDGPMIRELLDEGRRG